jgi:hypothetical protein
MMAMLRARLIAEDTPEETPTTKQAGPFWRRTG